MGVGAGFWHVLPVAGIVVFACGIIALFVRSSGYRQLELDHATAAAQVIEPSKLPE
ncbi:hypothetical protein [Nocardia seriolae]|uniref:MFS transporter n=1 Tax=Nocardia seriolae TaxID=37332 RepID=A0ABC8B445_9NOCA|nr:hypothetical protein [Nocardia seriolae]APB01401.1 hypothetical protein NS506_07381 [Nocardia seriolae]MTJ61109.1 hypothetical protein [Nocardia seriolae]MTJ75949.1 hypothetical protein [Nocardia seriolae]MTJ90763.1 hypothetical protein [Nocardia seriolae]MTK34722.1 hypothetical protein [Nocardia seriolae]